MNKIYNNSIVWLRRDIRLHDHAALHFALKYSKNVYCIFIFDNVILNDLNDKEDRRIEFIWESIHEIRDTLNKLGSDIVVRHGNPLKTILSLIKEYSIEALFLNKDYEKYAIDRDNEVAKNLKKINIDLMQYKDLVLYEELEILTQSQKPYTVFSPSRNNH